MITLFSVDNKTLPKPVTISSDEIVKMITESAKNMITFLTSCPIYIFPNYPFKISCLNTPDYKWLIVIVKN